MTDENITTENTSLEWRELQELKKMVYSLTASMITVTEHMRVTNESVEKLWKAIGRLQSNPYDIRLR